MTQGRHHRRELVGNESGGEAVAALVPMPGSHRSIWKTMEVNPVGLCVGFHRGYEVEHCESFLRSKRGKPMTGIKQISSANGSEVSGLEGRVGCHLNPGANNQQQEKSVVRMHVLRCHLNFGLTHVPRIAPVLVYRRAVDQIVDTRFAKPIRRN